MEDKLKNRIYEYLMKGNKFLGKHKLELAFKSYVKGLYVASTYLVYRDTGMLLPPHDAIRILQSRYPDVYDVVTFYSRFQGEISEVILGKIKRDLEDICDSLISKF